MDRPYRHFTLEERRTLFRLLNAKLPIKEIAGQLGRHRSTIYQEIARNEFREVKWYVTDKLASYPAAKQELIPGVGHTVGIRG